MRRHHRCSKGGHLRWWSVDTSVPLPVPPAFHKHWRASALADDTPDMDDDGDDEDGPQMVMVMGKLVEAKVEDESDSEPPTPPMHLRPLIALIRAVYDRKSELDRLARTRARALLPTPILARAVTGELPRGGTAAVVSEVAAADADISETVTALASSVSGTGDSPTLASVVYAMYRSVYGQQELTEQRLQLLFHSLAEHRMTGCVHLFARFVAPVAAVDDDILPRQSHSHLLIDIRDQ